MLMVVYYAVDATAKSTVKGTAKPIDIEAVQDSVLVMADEYAEALASKPEMAPTRMNLLKKFYKRQLREAQDSIRSSIFNVFTICTEQSKPNVGPTTTSNNTIRQIEIKI